MCVLIVNETKHLKEIINRKDTINYESRKEFELFQENRYEEFFKKHKIKIYLQR